MALIERTTTAGNIVEKLRYTRTERKDGPVARAEKKRISTAAKRAANWYSTQRKLYLLLAANFLAKHVFVTLTFDELHRAMTRAEAMNAARRYVRLFRSYCSGQGRDFKYIYALEHKHGLGRWHVHIVMDATWADVEAIKSLWEFGLQVDIETVGSRGYKQLAEYLTKERQEVGDRAFISSQNLSRPVVETRIVPETESEYIEVPDGCIELEREEKSNEWGRFCFVRYELPRRRSRVHIELDNLPDCYSGADLILSRGFV